MNPDRWREVERLYQSALQHEPRNRDAFLAEASGGDDELRRELETLLAQSGSTGALMDVRAWEAVERLAEARLILAPGAMLGPYEIVELVGEGAMAKVYRARDTRLGRTVAIKVCLDHFTDRFEREARAISALSHAHICSLYDVGPNYLVLEFVEGETLAQRIHRLGALTVSQAFDIGAQIAQAIEEAHRKDIVHRDLKPTNVKTTPDGRARQTRR
jgi:serine/threonine protein kinase